MQGTPALDTGGDEGFGRKKLSEIPLALLLGLDGLVAFLWALKSGQFDDLDGAAHRILFDEDDEDSRGKRP